MSVELAARFDPTHFLMRDACADLHQNLNLASKQGTLFLVKLIINFLDLSHQHSLLIFSLGCNCSGNVGLRCPVSVCVYVIWRGHFEISSVAQKAPHDWYCSSAAIVPH